MELTSSQRIAVKAFCQWEIGDSILATDLFYILESDDPIEEFKKITCIDDGDAERLLRETLLSEMVWGQSD